MRFSPADPPALLPEPSRTSGWRPVHPRRSCNAMAHELDHPISLHPRKPPRLNSRPLSPRPLILCAAILSLPGPPRLPGRREPRRRSNLLHPFGAPSRPIALNLQVLLGRQPRQVSRQRRPQRQSKPRPPHRMAPHAHLQSLTPTCSPVQHALPRPPQKQPRQRAHPHLQRPQQGACGYQFGVRRRTPPSCPLYTRPAPSRAIAWEEVS